ATSAELTARDPKQVVTYKINPRATWSDGTPVTEADFEAQWKADSGANPAYRISSANGYEQIESVARGADDREVVVTFKQPYADWKGLFSPLYPASTNNDPAVFNDGWVGKIPGATGPSSTGSSSGRSRATPRSTPSSTARSTSWTSAPTSTSSTGRRTPRASRSA